MLDMRFQQPASSDLTDVILVVESSSNQSGRVVVLRRRAAVSCAVLAVLVIAFCRPGAADVPINGDEPTRLPPIERASHEIEVMEQPPALLPYYVGYDRGFVIANHGTDGFSANEFPFVMRMNSWFQLRHALFESDGPNRDKNALTLERIRLVFGGHLYSPDLKYSLMLDGNTDQSVQVTFLDSFVTYDLGRAVWDWDAGQLEVRGGNWKVPFSRSREESARRFQFSERSVANLFFDIGRSVGASLLGETEALGVPLRFETALMNGLNTGRDSTLSGEDLDANLAWSARASMDLFSEFGNDGEPDLSWHPYPALRLGSGMAFTTVDQEGQSEFRRQRVVRSGERLSDLLPAAISAYDICLVTIDAHWKHRGWSLIAEHHWRYIADFRGGDVPSLLDQGLVLQTGYFVLPEKLELLARWSRIAGNSGTLGVENQHTDEVAGGLAWYIRRHDVKFNLDVSWIDGVPVNSSRLNLLPGDEGWLMRTQFQFAF
jgi:hypothetical protein